MKARRRLAAAATMAALMVPLAGCSSVQQAYETLSGVSGQSSSAAATGAMAIDQYRRGVATGALMDSAVEDAHREAAAAASQVVELPAGTAKVESARRETTDAIRVALDKLTAARDAAQAGNRTELFEVGSALGEQADRLEALQDRFAAAAQ